MHDCHGFFVTLGTYDTYIRRTSVSILFWTLGQEREFRGMQFISPPPHPFFFKDEQDLPLR